MLVLLFISLALLACNQGRKSDGKTQAGVDASVKGAIFAVLAVVAFMYLVGVA